MPDDGARPSAPWWVFALVVGGAVVLVWWVVGALLSTVGLSKGNLSSHMDRLEKAGYVEVTKSFNGKIPHTDYRLTRQGKAALAKYWRALDQIRAAG